MLTIDELKEFCQNNDEFSPLVSQIDSLKPVVEAICKAIENDSNIVAEFFKNYNITDKQDKWKKLFHLINADLAREKAGLKEYTPQELHTAKNILQTICTHLNLHFPGYTNQRSGGSDNKPEWKSTVTISTKTKDPVIVSIKPIEGISYSMKDADKKAAMQGIAALKKWANLPEDWEHKFLKTDQTSTTVTTTTLPGPQTTTDSQKKTAPIDALLKEEVTLDNAESILQKLCSLLKLDLIEHTEGITSSNDHAHQWTWTCTLTVLQRDKKPIGTFKACADSKQESQQNVAVLAMLKMKTYKLESGIGLSQASMLFGDSGLKKELPTPGGNRMPKKYQNNNG